MMMQSRAFAAAVATLAVLAAGCDRAPTVSADALTLDEARTVAEAYSQTGVGALAGPGGPSLSLEEVGLGGTVEFAFSQPCPRGGAARLEGTSTIVPAEAPGTGTFTLTGTRTDEACAVPVRRGQGTLTLDGNPNVALAIHHSWTDWTAGDLTATQKGSFRWSRSGGGSGTCDVDVTTTMSRATMRYTMQGRFCGFDVDISGG
jgi:hypothetical protein